MAEGRSQTAPAQRVIVSGMRPTGRLHMGNLLGALRNWVALQHDNRCFFFIADWHTLTTSAESESLAQRVHDMVIDWLAAGLDPERVVIFRQSSIKEHAELHLLLSMIVPTPWLLRNPTVKEQARDMGLIEGDDESEMTKINYGYLGYPVLQAADILAYKATAVPVGIDQAPHIEITREIARRFNHLFREVFPEPATLLTEVPKIPGTDGRKMSKSYNNSVYLSDAAQDVEQKLTRMATDPARVRRVDPGNPELCPAFQWHRIYCTAEEIDYVSQGCRTAGIGCVDCKRVMIKHVLAELEPMHARRAELTQQPDRVGDVLASGNRRAQEVAGSTLAEVRDALGLA
ncbi:MAG TPA: tryptophan--tRNA ligase [Terriglobales bacterium]|nr:tryptophan--tRNA ligase [Terriglobales bacterium]